MALIVWNSSFPILQRDARCIALDSEELRKIGFLYGAVCRRLAVNYQLFHKHFRALSAIQSTWIARLTTTGQEKRKDGREKFSPVQKWCRRWVGTGDVAMIALRLSVRRLLLMVVHHVLLVVRPAILLESRLRESVLAVELIVML